MVDDPEVDEELGKEHEKNYERNVALARARFLENAFEIDHIVTQIIALVVQPEKEEREYLQTIVLGHRALSSSVKHDMLLALSKVRKIDGLDKSLFNLLERHRKFRNKLAHGIVDTRSKLGKVLVTTFDDGKKVTTEIGIVEWVRTGALAKSVVDLLKAILDKLTDEIEEEWDDRH